MNIFSKILFFLNLKFHNIYMVFTRSQLKNMSITSEMREYFENLMKPLVTNETLEQQLKFFQDGLMKKIEDKFKEQNDRLEELVTWVLNSIKLKSIVLITFVKLIWTRRKIKFDQLLLNLDHGNQEQPFTKPDQETI